MPLKQGRVTSPCTGMRQETGGGFAELSCPKEPHKPHSHSLSSHQCKDPLLLAFNFTQYPPSSQMTLCQIQLLFYKNLSLEQDYLPKALKS